MPENTPTYEKSFNLLQKIADSDHSPTVKSALIQRAKDRGLISADMPMIQTDPGFIDIGPRRPFQLDPPDPTGQAKYEALSPTERIVVGLLQYGGRKALLDVVDFIPNVLNIADAAMTKLTGGQPSPLHAPGELITEVAPSFTQDFIEPKTTAEKYLFRTAREAGGALQSLGVKPFRGLVAPSEQVIASRGLGRVAAEEALTATATGLAGQAVVEADLGPITEILAQLTTGAITYPIAARTVTALAKLPGLKPGDIPAVLRTLTRAPEDLRNRLMAGGKVEKRFADFTITQLRREGMNDVADRLEEAIRLQQTVPDFQPTLGRVTEAPALTRLEQSSQPTIQEPLIAARHRMEEGAQQIRNRIETELEIPQAPGSDFEIAGRLDPRLQSELQQIEVDSATQIAPLRQRQQTLRQQAAEERIQATQQARARKAAAAQQLREREAELGAQLTEQRETANVDLTQRREQVRVEAAQQRTESQIQTARRQEAVTERIRLEARRRSARINANIDRRLNKANDRLAQITENQFKSPRRFVASETGTVIRDEVEAGFKAFREEAARQFDPFVDKNLKAPVSDLFDKIESVRSSAELNQRLGDFPSREVNDLIQSVKQGVDPNIDPRTLDVTFDQLKRFRTNLLEYQRVRGPNHDATNLIDATHDAMRHIAEARGRPDLIASFDEARAWYRENVRKFVTGVGETILKKSVRTYEGYTTSVSNVLDNIFANPTREKALQFLELTEGTSNARAAAIEYLANDLFLRAGRNPTQRDLDTWFSRNATTINTLEDAGITELSTSFGSIERARRRVDEVIASSKRIENAVRENVQAAGAQRRQAAQELESIRRQQAQEQLDISTAETRNIQQAAEEARQQVEQVRTTVEQERDIARRTAAESERAAVADEARAKFQRQQTIGTEQAAITAELKAINDARRRSEREALQKYFAPKAAGEVSPSNIRGLLNTKNPGQLAENARRLMQATDGDDIAQRGVRRALADELWTRAGGKGDRFVELLDANKAALAVVDIRGTSFNILRDHAKALGILSAPIPPANVAPGSTREINELFIADELAKRFARVGMVSGVFSGAAIAGIIGYKSGASFPAMGVGAMAGANIGKRILEATGGKLGRGVGTRIDREMASLLEEAVFNPDLRKTLDMVREGNVPTPMLRARFHAHIVQLGLGTRTENERVEREQELERRRNARITPPPPSTP